MEVVTSDRRSYRRYPIALNLEYRISADHSVLAGNGETRDLSSRGFSFEVPGPLPIGAFVEVDLNWPAPEAGNNSVKLTLRGHVVRSDASRTAVQTVRYAFRREI